MISRMIALTVTLISLASAQSHATPAVIQYVNCGSVDARAGSTSIVFTGNFAGELYFNVTNVNQFGIPFSQQARLLDTRATATGLEFKLQAMMTGAIGYLTIVNGTNEGLFATSPGDDQDGIRLKCTAQINRL